MAGAAFDGNKAVLLGRFVGAAYTMYGQNPANLTPQPSNDFPHGYTLTAWVQMQDFVLDNTTPVFYGFIAHNNENPNQAVLAIRGTSNGNIEWWDDFNSLGSTPFKVPGRGERWDWGLRITTRSKLSNVPVLTRLAPYSLGHVGSFSGSSGRASNAPGSSHRFWASRGTRAVDRGNRP